ncbi:hypothetical protein [Parabacteroides sp.]
MDRIKIALFCVLCFFMAITGIQAQTIESVELQDGSVLEGYISGQYPGKSITFSASQATIVIPSKSVSSIREHRIDLASLPLEWKQWMDTHAKREKDLLLSDIFLVDESVKLASDTDTVTVDRRPIVPDYLRVSPRKVKVLEKGEMIKYVDVMPQTYSLKWSDVKYVRRTRRSDLALSGLNEVIRLKENGNEYTGEILEQILGKQIRLLKKDGVIEVINPAQIASIRKVKLNLDQEVFKQTPLLDHVYTHSGNVISGIIMEQNFVSAGEKAGYLTVLSRNGESRVVSYPDVEKYGRSLNPDYKLQTDILLDDTTLMVNRRKARFTDFEQDSESFLFAKETEGKVSLRKDSLEEKQFIVLEVKDSPEADDYVLIRAVEKKEMLAQEKLRIKGQAKEARVKEARVKQGFTYENLAIYSTRAVEQTVSVNGTRKMRFSAANPGLYVLYLPKMKKGILCLVE